MILCFLCFWSYNTLGIIEMSGSICGYASCMFYLGSWVPQLHRNISALFVLHTLINQTCFSSLFVYLWKMCLEILRSAFATHDMEVPASNWFLSDFCCCSCLLSSVQLWWQSTGPSGFCLSLVCGACILTPIQWSHNTSHKAFHLDIMVASPCEQVTIPLDFQLT